MKIKQTIQPTLPKQIAAALAQGLQAFCMAGAIIATALVFINVMTPGVTLTFMTALKVNENLENGIYKEGTEADINNMITSLVNSSTNMAVNFAVAAAILALVVWFLSQRDRHDNLRLATALGMTSGCVVLAAFSQNIVRVMLSMSGL